MYGVRVDESQLQKRVRQPVRTTETAEPGAGDPAGGGALRASDADRDRVSDILSDALAEGRITSDEHSERLDRVYEARTIGELEPIVRDLPATAYPHPGSLQAPHPYAAPSGPPPSDEPERLIAVFGGASRKGRWRVGRLTHAFAMFGGIDIDLTEAVFEHREITVRAIAVWGGVDIKVPENVTLRGDGTGVFGGFDVKAYEAPDAGAPVVVVRGVAVFGGVDAKAQRGKRLKDWVRKPLDG